MSIRVIEWVFKSAPVTSPSEQLVLLAIADSCSRDDGTGAYPSLTTLQRKTKLSRQGVLSVINRLEEGRRLVVHRGASIRATNLYEVVMLDQPTVNGADPSDCRVVNPVDQSVVNGVDPSDCRVVNPVDQTWSTPLTSGGQPRRPYPSFDPSLIRERATKEYSAAPSGTGAPVEKSVKVSLDLDEDEDDPETWKRAVAITGARLRLGLTRRQFVLRTLQHAESVPEDRALFRSVELARVPPADDRLFGIIRARRAEVGCA